MESFNKKYTKWKAEMVELINKGGIPLAVVDDFLTTLKAEIGRALANEAQEQAVPDSEDKDDDEAV